MERCCEQEKVRREPPGRKCRKAWRLRNLYPPVAPSTSPRLRANEGGSRTMISKLVSHSLRYVKASPLRSSELPTSTPFNSRFRSARSSAVLEESNETTSLAPPPQA